MNMISVPKDFGRALRESGLDEFFAECPYVPRAEYLRWISAAKRPVTRRFRIRRAVVKLFAHWMDEMKAAQAARGEGPSPSLCAEGHRGNREDQATGSASSAISC